MEKFNQVLFTGIDWESFKVELLLLLFDLTSSNLFTVFFTTDIDVWLKPEFLPIFNPELLPIWTNSKPISLLIDSIGSNKAKHSA